MRSYALPVVLLLLLAGCSGGSGGSTGTDSDASAGADEDGRTSAAGDQKGTAAPTSFEDVSWDGDVGTQLCAAPGGTEVCPTSPLGPPTDPANRDGVVFIADTAGPAQLSGNLTLSWEAADFAITSNLAVVVGVYKECASTCRFDRTAGTASGPSPLTLPVDGIRLGDGERMGLYLRPPHSMIANTEVTVSAGQPVHLEGRIGIAPA